MYFINYLKSIYAFLFYLVFDEKFDHTVNLDIKKVHRYKSCTLLKYELTFKFCLNITTYLIISDKWYRPNMLRKRCVTTTFVPIAYNMGKSVAKRFENKFKEKDTCDFIGFIPNFILIQLFLNGLVKRNEKALIKYERAKGYR